MRFKKIKGPQNHNLFQPYGRDGEVRGVYWVRFFRTGKGRLEESLKTDFLGDARIRRDLRIAEFLGEKARFKSSVFLVGDKFPEFVDLKKVKAKSTYDSICNSWVNHLQEYFQSKLLTEVTESEWLRYVAWKRSQPDMADRKFFNDRKYLAMFLNWLHRDGLISVIPKLPIVDTKSDPKKVYSDQEISEFLAVADVDLRDQIIMGITMGMRHGEIWSLEWDQINWKKGTIFLPAHKTKIRKARTFVASPQGSEVLKRRREASESSWVFPHPDDKKRPAGRFGEKSAWDRLRDETGIDGTFHELRHTFLTRAFKTSTNPALICDYAGLSLEEAYRTYLHFTPEDTLPVAGLVRVEI